MDYYYIQPRPWYRPRVRTILLWVLLAIIASSLYSYWSDAREQAERRERELLSPPRGAMCRIELEPQISGATATPLTVSGRFVMLNDRWVVVDGQSEGAPQQWVPRERVVVLKVSP